MEDVEPHDAFDDGGVAWRAAPAGAQHPAAGARWRFSDPRPRSGPHEYDIELRSLRGARAVRAVHTGPMRLAEHGHAWPTLLLHLVGSYSEAYEEGEVQISGPAGVLHPAGHAHANVIGDSGFEAVAIHFDPSWLGDAGAGLGLDRSRCWTSGRTAAAARTLAAAWADPGRGERELARLTGRFLRAALADDGGPAPPRWLDHVRHALETESPPSIRTLARRLDLNPEWLAKAYRARVGEGVRDTVRRKRVERAGDLLRGSDLPLAEVAVAAGFCDQSHMNRAFRQLTCRTPAQVRAERRLLDLSV